jgi:Flp pilus assembly pilin Flp
MTWYRFLLEGDEGSSAIEYALVASLIAVGLIVSLNNMADALVETYSEITVQINEAQ